MEKLKLKRLPEGLQKAVEECPLIIGVGPSAWPRMILGFYFPQCKIITFYDCQDNDLVRDFGIEIFSLQEKQPELELVTVTPGQILDTQLVKDFLTSQTKPFVFFVYKSSYKLEKVCQENDWKVVSNKKDLMEFYENKRIFKEVLREVGIEPIPGDNLPVEDLTKERLLHYQRKFGQKKLALQLAEMTYGGGVGTLFVNDPCELVFFRQRVAEIKEILKGKKKKIETVNVSPFIQGIPVGIPCCATRYGILSGPVHTQIMDIEEVGTKIKNRSGNYAGIDWDFYRYSEKTQSQASRIAERFGEHMYQKGYRGIFGLDLIVEEKSGKIWPVECNPRETDAFPLISMLWMERDFVPFEVFHTLEHLGIDYKIDFEKVNQAYKQISPVSQIVLHNKTEQEVMVRNPLKAGIYRLEGGKLKYLRPGFLLFDLKTEDEFLFAEWLPKASGRVYPPSGRIVRLIKRGGMLEKQDELKEELREVIESAYKEMKLLPVETGLKDQRGLKILFADKLLAAKKSPDLPQADVVNVISKIKGGFWRPLKVAWRKKLTDEPIISQIRSKRARKQIKSDEKRLADLRVEIKAYSQIDKGIFAQWLALYRKIISQKEKGELIVKEDWLERKEKAGKQVGAVLAYRSGKLIGGNLFFGVRERLCVGYGVAEKIPELVGGLGLLLDYYFLRSAQEKGYKEISFGQDTNLYGFDLSPGLLFYKAKLGFSPVPANKTYWVTTFFRSFKKLGEPVMFFGGSEEKLILNIIYKKPPQEVVVYLPERISTSQVFEGEAVVRQHRQILEESQ
jgi:hypothetical protein